MSEAPRVSVVIATYQRPALLARLLDQLSRQTLPAAEYEIVVVDDGSKEPVAPSVEARGWPCAVAVITQENAGAGAARHRGIQRARGELLVLVDDDMQVGEGFLAAHVAAHPEGTRRCVLGRIRPPEDDRLSLSERWQQENFDALAERLRAGGRPLQGNSLYTGNVSMRRADYVAAGGFDTTFTQAEDAELGLRLEARGVEMAFAPDAWTINGSDHVGGRRWRLRARRYGGFDLRMARRHPRVRHASPWRFLGIVHPLARPLLFGSALLPPAAAVAAPAAYGAGALASAVGLRRLAHAALTVAFGCEYFRGARAEAGSTRALLGYLADHLALPDPRRPGARGWPSARFVAAVRADHATMRRYEAKYGHTSPSRGSLLADLVQKIGFQILVAVRWMHLLKGWRLGLLARIQARAIRHLYGSDIHPDAEIAPGVMLVHGFGLAISPAARIGSGCILFQNVTLGMGVDAETRQPGAPTLEEEVHVMPGATLIGPIRVGAGSKVMAGVVLTRSVPAGCLVEAPPVEVRHRDRRLAPVADGRPEASA